MKIVFNKIGVVGIVALLGACAAGTSAKDGEAAAFVSTPPGAEGAPAVTEVASQDLAAGLYQIAYSKKHDVLWVTSAVGRPPVKQSALIKIDPKTRQVLASFTPPVLDAATGNLEAVYGVDVDDAHDRVWVTNTRNDSVAVYDQATGRRVAGFGNVAHSREVIVDEARHTAWVSAFGGTGLVAFDTDTLQETRRVNVEGSGPTGLALDHVTGTVYATDLTKHQIIVVPGDGYAPRLIPTPGAGPQSIDISADGRTLYTADQTAGTASIIDVASGSITKTIATGAGALAARIDAATNKLFVANRGAGTISVIDVKDGVVTETIATKANPNHLAVVDGILFAVDKSAAGVDRKDTFYAITPRR